MSYCLRCLQWRPEGDESLGCGTAPKLWPWSPNQDTGTHWDPLVHTPTVVLRGSTTEFQHCCLFFAMPLLLLHLPRLFSRCHPPPHPTVLLLFRYCALVEIVLCCWWRWRRGAVPLSALDAGEDIRVAGVPHLRPWRQGDFLSRYLFLNLPLEMKINKSQELPFLVDWDTDKGQESYPAILHTLNPTISYLPWNLATVCMKECNGGVNGAVVIIKLHKIKLLFSLVYHR